jgi:Protein of unknown function (DUF2844)
MKELALRAVSITLAAIVSIGCAAPSAVAALGDSVQSVTADQQRMAGQLRTLPQTAGANFTVQEIAAPSGVTVREYVSPDGIVFAVSWRGPVPPDLSTLLGSYYDQYKAAAAASKARQGLHHLTVQTDQVVVQTGGHMRDMWGRAFVPVLVPPGVDKTEIR